MDSNIAFIPDRSSVFYSTFGKEEEPNNWFIDIPNGKYRVSVTLGDADLASTHYLQANGLPFKGSPMQLAARVYKTFAMEVRITTNRLTLTATCPKEDGIKCKRALTRIVGVKIEVVKDNDKNQENSYQKEISLSKNSKSGGNCTNNSLNCVFDTKELTSTNCPG